MQHIFCMKLKNLESKAQRVNKPNEEYTSGDFE